MREYRVLVVPANTEQPLRVKTLRTGDLEAMQRIVGGLIEPVDIIGPDATIWVNEEGKVHDLPYNRRATGVAVIHDGIRLGDYVAGDAFITGATGMDGYSTSVPEIYLDHVRRFV